MLEQTMPLDQAFNLIDQALANVNANRETHAILQASVVRIKSECQSLEGRVAELTEQVNQLIANQNMAASEVANAIG